MYIVLEGQDATGKDTQARFLVQYFEQQGKKVACYSESGTGSKDPFITEIARLNYGSKQDINHQTRVLLYLVNRYEQWRKIAEPVLAEGGVVITTRNWFSTLIYEGYAGGVPKDLIVKLHQLMMPERYFKPDKIVIMTVAQAERQKRLAAHGQRFTGGEIWKSQAEEFHQKLGEGYLQIAKEYNVPTVDSVGTIEEVKSRLWQALGLEENL